MTNEILTRAEKHNVEKWVNFCKDKVGMEYNKYPTSLKEAITKLKTNKSVPNDVAAEGGLKTPAPASVETEEPAKKRFRRRESQGSSAAAESPALDDVLVVASSADADASQGRDLMSLLPD